MSDGNGRQVTLAEVRQAFAETAPSHHWLGTRRYFGRCGCGWTSKAHLREDRCRAEHDAHLTHMVVLSLTPATEATP